MLNPAVVGQRHYHVAQEVRRILAEYEELKDVIAMLGLEELAEADRRTVNIARQLERFLTQPFFSTEQFTGLEGKFIKLEDTISGCERIIAGEFLSLAEKAFYMTGTIDDLISAVTEEKAS